MKMAVKTQRREASTSAENYVQETMTRSREGLTTYRGNISRATGIGLNGITLSGHLLSACFPSNPVTTRELKLQMQ